MISLNRLAKEKSPYLRHYTSSSFDWYPWCDEAIAKAVAEDKPILLSVGYSTCHWCHVMNRESFMDEAYTTLISALDFKNTQPVEVVIAGDFRRAKPLLEEVYQTLLPKRILAQSADGSGNSILIPLVKGKAPIQGSPTAYVCKQNRHPPTPSREELRRLLTKQQKIEKGSRGCPPSSLRAQLLPALCA